MVSDAEVTMARAWQLTFDCADPAALSAFWAETLGYVLQPPPDGYDDWPTFLTAMDVPVEDHDSASAIVDPDGSGHRIYFQRVPEGKSVKNRLHVDVPVSGGPHMPLERRIPLQDEEGTDWWRLGRGRSLRYTNRAPAGSSCMIPRGTSSASREAGCEWRILSR